MLQNTPRNSHKNRKKRTFPQLETTKPILLHRKPLKTIEEKIILYAQKTLCYSLSCFDKIKKIEKNQSFEETKKKQKQIREKLHEKHTCLEKFANSVLRKHNFKTKNNHIEKSHNAENCRRGTLWDF